MQSASCPRGRQDAVKRVDENHRVGLPTWEKVALSVRGESEARS